MPEAAAIIAVTPEAQEPDDNISQDESEPT